MNFSINCYFSTVPSVDLALHFPNLAGLILHSPLMSGMRVAFPGTTRTHCFDVFPSIDKIPVSGLILLKNLYLNYVFREYSVRL